VITKGEKMLYKMYTIHDSKAEIFHPPYVKHSHGEAERDFTTAVNDERTNMNKYPEDFNLYYVGSWDDNTGKAELLDSPQHIIKAIQCIRPLSDVPIGHNLNQMPESIREQSQATD
jgi:hypothetical protein